MKKIIIPALLALSTLGAMAQSEFDALKYSQSDIIGTARYMSMGGAFGALGGDGSSIHLNPAGLGVYRSSELSITTGLTASFTDGKWSGYNTDESRYRVPFNNFTFVLNFDGPNKNKGLVNSSLGITYNKAKNFYRNIYLKGIRLNNSITDYMQDLGNYYGYTEGPIDGNDPTGGLVVNNLNDGFYYAWLPVLGYNTGLMRPTNPDANDGAWSPLLNPGEKVNASYELSEEGYIGEWGFSYGMNFSNLVHVGATVGLKTVNYNRTSAYTESFEDRGDMKLSNDYFETTGTGWNFKIGTIVRPIDMVRLGASIQTPTFYNLEDFYYSTMFAQGLDPNYVLIDRQAPYSSLGTPDGFSTYKLQDPFRYDLSAAVIFGKKGLLSFDFGGANYPNIKLSEPGGITGNYFNDINNGIKNVLKNSYTFRVGGEFKVTDELALRAGYALETASMQDDAVKFTTEYSTRTDPEYFIDNQNASYYSAGIGYREKYWFIDFAYQMKYYKQDFRPYNQQELPLTDEPASVTNKINNFVLTLGLKF